MQSILIVAEDSDTIQKIDSSFEPEHRIETAPNKERAIEILKRTRHDLIFIDLSILLASVSGKDFQEALQPFVRLYPSIEIVVLLPKEMTRQAIEALRAGVSNYLTYPVTSEEIRLVTDAINQSILQRSELDYLRDKFWRSESLDMVQTRNYAMRRVFDKIRSAAPTRSTILLTGETGTGKGMMARLIHQHSNRLDDQFISVHCGAIPDTLLESELFGHEKGAFTGAIKRKLGKFEVAKGGTLFLDEVGTITPAAQIKLLQVLQDGTFSRVGGENTLKTDARLIVATNSNLKDLSENGQFRRDLYYRLNVFPIEIPPLRERMEDLPQLIAFLLKKINGELNKEIRGVSPYVTEALKRYHWPGNIRELENLIERACILETSTVLNMESFPAELFEQESQAAILPVDSGISLADARQKAIEEFERQYLKDLISRNQGKINKSSEEAGISTRQLHKLLSKYGIRKDQYRA
jgi:DNA-binding NtrC family response regulator